MTAPRYFILQLAESYFTRASLGRFSGVSSGSRGTRPNGASGDTLGGTGLPTPTTEAAALELFTTGLPKDPDSARYLQLTDAVSWGCAGCSGAPLGGNFSTAIFSGVWPGALSMGGWAGSFVTVGATDSSINLITAGENSNGTASWTTSP